MEAAPDGRVRAEGKMVMLKVSDYVHTNSEVLLKLKDLVGKMQTSQDALEALLNRLVVLPQELLDQVDDFIKKSKQLGFKTREQFVNDAVRFRLTWFKEDNQCLEISRRQYDLLEEAIEAMGAPFHSAENFITSQINTFIEKYEGYKEATKQ